MLSIVLLFLVGLVVAQQPRPCTSPSQWEARVISHINNENITVQGKLSYDSVYQRERFIEQVVVGDDYYYETIVLFQVRLEFVINLTARNCSRLPLTRPWRDFSIRPDAHSYGEAYIGSSASPSTGLLITMWWVNWFRFHSNVDCYLWIGVVITRRHRMILSTILARGLMKPVFQSLTPLYIPSTAQVMSHSTTFLVV